MSEKNNKYTPNLRFPEFTGEWEEKKLGEVAKKVNRKNTLLKVSRVLTNSANLGVVDQGAYFDRDIAVKENTGNYSIVEIEDFVYNPRISTAAPVGPISINKVGQGIMSPLYTIFKFHTGSVPFYEQYFQTTIWHSYLKGIANFGARFDRMNITTEGFFNMPLYLPTNPAEQQKIASCLSTMDDLIAAQAEKVEALKEKKTGLMQQMFPQAGETTPRLRFPEFKGEWEVKNLGEVCDSILVGFPFKGEDITDDASGHPILRAFSIGEGIIRHGKDYDKYYPYDAEKLKKYEVRKGDIVISMDGSVGKNIAMVSEKEERNLLIQRVARLRITNYPIHLIFQQIISQRFKDYAAGEKKGAVIAHISQKQIELFPIYVPDSPAEQQKIASCLSALDDQIAAETEKLTALKDYKKGLMQQLFPQPAK